MLDIIFAGVISLLCIIYLTKDFVNGEFRSRTRVQPINNENTCSIISDNSLSIII